MQNRDLIMRIVAVALLLYSLASLSSQLRQLQTAEALSARLETELLQLKDEQAALMQKLNGSGRDEEMRRLAWERLGMVLPGEKIFYFSQGPD